MPVPIVCLDARLRQFAATFDACFSAPQRRHFVTVLLALLLCREPRTLSGLRRQVAGGRSVAALSRFLGEAPWSAESVAATWHARFAAQVAPLVAAEHRRQRAARGARRGRPGATVVTGYLIGDDSTLHKPKGKKMAGLGRHYSTTLGKPVPGHSLVQGLYVVQGRRCPLAPRLYRQQAVCQAAGQPFRSKIDLMIEVIRTFAPLPETQTHVLVDSWYSAKAVWRAARERRFLITSGLKANRSLRVPDPEEPGGWRWQPLAEYAAGRPDEAYTAVTWPTQDGGRTVYAHAVQTRVRKLYRCQVVIVRERLDAPLSQARYWASSDLTADLATLVGHIAARWQVEVLFADAKDVLGLDQYQLMGAAALVRFWTLVLAAYIFLEEEQARLGQERPCAPTIGEARCAVQRVHQRHLLVWLQQQFQAGATPEVVAEALAA
jgi:DDE superfamily endonuclease